MLVWSLIIVISLSSLIGSLYGVSWLSWMKDLVPEDEKGRYFSRRNLICGAIGLVISLVAGKLFDQWQVIYLGRLGKATGFCILFAAATAFGLLALIYLRQVPEPSLHKPKDRESSLGSLALPFRDRNFLILMSGYAFWTFAIWVAAPFFGVYMLKHLQLSYMTINLLSAVSVAACLAATNLSGRMTDRFGNKPVLIVCIFGNAFFPLLMAFTTPSSYALLVAAHLLGFFAAGLGLGANNILLKLSPKENNAVYLAAFSSLSAVAAALGPVAGGLLMKLFHNFSLDLHLVVLDDVKVVFLAAFVLRLLSLLSFFAVREPKAEPVGRMIRVVWNEVNLNPFEGFGQMVQQWMAPPVSRRTSSGAEYPIPPSEFDESPKPPKIEDESLFPF
jgi:MFS family permease